ncbi:Putative AC transposase [Rhizoctonia solani]|uniref:Putative AC transposase n=1 Tax=Rhizoctonia solani TaxID=456999 RepID=A0A0K6FYI8_9AGAM|nr:Putative AC transposase [Rhizoctonia solani]
MILYEGMTATEIKKLSDAEVWSWPDDIIIAASQAKWRAPIYGHYTISLRRENDKFGGKTIWFVFACKTNPVRHKPQTRQRGDDSSGTKKFNNTANKCNLQCARVKGAEETTSRVREFSPARFRALIALWCARNHRPFEMVSDDLLVAIVNELRPGTALPDPTTLSRDVQSLYRDNMEAIRHYFKGIDYIHLAMDGWTAPTSRSYLGVVIIWQTAGELRRAILEFIQLTKRHTGEYLAQKTSECLNKYELGPKLLTVCMDNASNNNTFTTELQKLFPSFGGPKFRSRCGAHIGNLMAKAYLSIFSKPTTRKRGPLANEVVPTPPTKRRRANGSSADAIPPQSLEENALDADIESDNAEGLVDNIDDDKAEYDTVTVKASVAAAFSEAEKTLGIVISESDRQMAQQLLPKISGLANRAKNSPVVQHKFEQYVASIPGLGRSPHPSLPCSVPTRWNTELISIRGHVQKRAAVKQLTADQDLSLREYQLTDPQWELSEQLVSELRFFERLTLLFSETQVPLIHQVVPILLKLRDRLRATIKNPAPGLHPLLQVAALASLKVFDKYMRLFEDASIYWVAIVMCPHYKLEWFRLLTTIYLMSGMKTSQRAQKEASQCTQNLPLVDGWLSDDEIGFTPSSKCVDTLRDYLSAPLVPIETLRRSGLLAYWNEQQRYTPRVAKFALSILGAPASSVDAERAFSGCRLTVNHLQHSMGDLTFEAKMAVGSWYNTPLLPSVDAAAAIISERLRH